MKTNYFKYLQCKWDFFFLEKETKELFKLIDIDPESKLIKGDFDYNKYQE